MNPASYGSWASVSWIKARRTPPGFGVDTDYDGDEDHENYATRVTAMSIAVGIEIVKICTFFLSILESEY